jgi:hypothetical protein
MNNSIKTIALVCILIYIIASGIWIFNANSGRNKAESQLAEYKKNNASTSEDIQSELLLMNRLSNADHNFFNGKYQLALDSFKVLLASANNSILDKKFIELRISEVESLLNNSEPNSAALKNVKSQLDTALQEIENHKIIKDSLLVSQSSKTKELTTKIESLEKTIQEKEKQLQAKDKVQVISFRNENGNMVHYLGNVSNGKANGNGTGIWDTGGIYKGEWKDNKRHGQGSYTWKDGHRYEGIFIEGIREGQGTYHWASGEKYVGQWKNNQRHGEGILYDRDNNIQHKGTWENDKIK